MSIIFSIKFLWFIDKSLRQRPYFDLQREIKRQFEVNTYKAIKRSQLDKAKEIVRRYVQPLFRQDEIIIILIFYIFDQ